MGLFDSLGQIVKGNQEKKAQIRNVKATKEARQQGLEMISNQDWEPELASDHIGTYQRSQSPVADAFLESFLTGSNPSAVQGTKLGAEREKGQKQQAFNQQYGGFDRLRKRQQQVQQATPWEVKPFEGTAIKEVERRNVQAPGFERFGLSPDDVAMLEVAGINLDPVSGEPRGTPKESGIPLHMIGRWTPERSVAMAKALREGDSKLARDIYMGVR